MRAPPNGGIEAVNRIYARRTAMDASAPKPRVNGSMVPHCIGKYVCLVGRNLGVGPGGMSLNIETSDKQKLTAKFSHPLTEPPSLYVEVLGRVEYDCSVIVERFVNFGSDFDLEAYDEVIQLMKHFPDYFPPSPH